MVNPRLVVLVSAYREGPLVEAAISSALAAEPDLVLVFEGPAGPSIDEDLPATDYGRFDRLRGPVGLNGLAPVVSVQHGAWEADAEKRTAMVREVQRRLHGPTWGLWLDGDELLKNPECLGDWCRYWTWQDEQAQLQDSTVADSMGWPIRLVELDGAVAICRGKLVRVDLIDRYEVSSSVFVNKAGIRHGEGNVPELLSVNDGVMGFGQKMLLASELDRMIVPSWLVAEPYLVHRSFLRHPRRSGLRLHEQEARQIELAQARDNGRET